jgi:hypothetical protein
MCNCKKNCTKQKIVLFYDKETQLTSQNVYKSYFSNLDITNYLLDNNNKDNILDIVKNFVNKGVRKFILQTYSSTLKTYFMDNDVISMYDFCTFIPTYSTAPSLRINNFKNLYFAIQDDTSFIEKLTRTYQSTGGTGVTLISDNSNNIYIQEIKALALLAGLSVIDFENINTVESQTIISNSNNILLSTLSYSMFLEMNEEILINQGYTKFMSALDFGPYNEQTLNSLNEILKEATFIRYLIISPSSLLALNELNPWVLSTKLSSLSFNYPYVNSLYLILININNIKCNLIRPNLIQNNTYYVYGVNSIYIS